MSKPERFVNAAHRAVAAAALLAAACSDLAAGRPPASRPARRGRAAAADRARPPTSLRRRDAPKAPLLEQEVAYGEAQKRNLVGFLAMPRDAAEPLPGIIVIHEWWGLNDEIKAMTRRLAGEGYVALAVDLYGGATATTPGEGAGADDRARRAIRMRRART